MFENLTFPILLLQAHATTEIYYLPFALAKSLSSQTVDCLWFLNVPKDEELLLSAYLKFFSTPI